MVKLVKISHKKVYITLYLFSQSEKILPVRIYHGLRDWWVHWVESRLEWKSWGHGHGRGGCWGRHRWRGYRGWGPRAWPHASCPATGHRSYLVVGIVQNFWQTRGIWISFCTTALMLTVFCATIHRWLLSLRWRGRTAVAAATANSRYRRRRRRWRRRRRNHAVTAVPSVLWVTATVPVARFRSSSGKPTGSGRRGVAFLVAKLLFTPPFGSSVGEPNLVWSEIKKCINGTQMQEGGPRCNGVLVFFLHTMVVLMSTSFLLTSCIYCLSSVTFIVNLAQLYKFNKLLRHRAFFTPTFDH